MDAQFELGAGAGRRQSLGLIASRGSAADVECVRKIRDEKLYKSLHLS